MSVRSVTDGRSIDSAADSVTFAASSRAAPLVRHGRRGSTMLCRQMFLQNLSARLVASFLR